ncbi:helix-turn-helix transcriptional regulator [Methylococcus sp. ANG]|uniref:helix-turn-helix transcriptional regulator n=1 Tax=Methylococcus sp. ANG TaxID=3231903 RepID=UPI00345A5E17
MASKQQQIHDLWDRLAEFGPTRVNEALDHAMASLCEIIGARQACWFGAVRLDCRDDPIDGWRACAIRYLHPHPERDAAYAEHCRRLDRGDIDPSIIANLRHAGRFRVSIQHEIVPPGWYDSEFYRNLFEPFGIRDVCYMATPVNSDMESWFGFERVGSEAPLFGEVERELLERAGRALKWFHRQVALHHGLTIASKPLTPAERRLLNALLCGASEAEIAERLGLTPTTVHTYATRIYRKFGVKGRTGLAALWLGR